ncbi:MAG: SidJ-related pseudokinase [Methanophagales archaeon]|nr:SidJ-related pseudokinase [Methanophagales archaeon]
MSWPYLSLYTKDPVCMENILRKKGLDPSTYRAADNALVYMIQRRPELIPKATFQGLENILKTKDLDFYAYRAAGHALSIPVLIKGPVEVTNSISIHKKALALSLEELTRGEDVPYPSDLQFMGRSLIGNVGEDKILVVKLLRKEEKIQSLLIEARWMEYLGMNYSQPARFDIPKAIRTEGGYIFRLKNIPLTLRTHEELSPYAIAFFAHKDYFTYCNDSKKVNPGEFKEVMFRSSQLLGHLTSLGIIHTKPIALFHNRPQVGRRADQGRYDWEKRGRLDRWLFSLDNPNIGITGIRDFEHFIAFDENPLWLYHYIGIHYLSLMLLLGSYFRNRDRSRMGWDSQGKPVDTRDLFDKSLLSELIQGVFQNYYTGFTGRVFCQPLHFLDNLVLMMIEEMGVDTYMEEILRRADQGRMSADKFRQVLIDGGYTEGEIRGFVRGQEDITIRTGPHLGGFNADISLPEITTATAIMTGLTLSGRLDRNSQRASIAQ